MAKALLSSDCRYCIIYCPGCRKIHPLYVSGDNKWDWNGSEQKPTFKPSLLCYPSYRQPRCHSYITDGVIEFLPDCDHALKGQKIPLEDVEAPKWFQSP